MKNKNTLKIIKTFYSDYPEIPYISDERKEDWFEMAKMFPDVVVNELMMFRYSDGLLPGHVYMLYWLGKYTNKKVPAYFEYKYGIDFEKEKEFLYNQKFINDINKPTPKGEKAIQDHIEVIERHNRKKQNDPVKQVLNIKENIEILGFKEYVFIANDNCCPECAKLNGKHFLLSDFKIGVNAPPMHEDCRCSIASYEDNSEYEAWLEHIGNGGTTEEWEVINSVRKITNTTKQIANKVKAFIKKRE